jgi:hypothetical protein
MVISAVSEHLDRPPPGLYRHQLKPVITKGAETMNALFNQHNQAKSA